MKSENTFSLTLNMVLLRSLQEDRPADGGRLSRYSAFVYLLERANKEPGKAISYGQEFHLSVGQLVTSYSELAVVWGWSRDNVRNFFLEMTKTGAILVERQGRSYPFPYA